MNMTGPHDARLTAKQQRFIGEFQIDYNATQAALRSGYSKRTARVIASENLLKPNIKKALDAARLDLSRETQLNAAWIEQRLMRVVKDCLTPQPVLDRHGVPTGLFAFDSAGAIKALSLLGRRLGMFEEHAPGEAEQPLSLALPPQVLLAWAARIRAREQNAACQDRESLQVPPPDAPPLEDPPDDLPDAPPLDAPPLDPPPDVPPPDDAPPEDAPPPAPPLDPPNDAPPLKTDRARLLARLLTPSDQPPRPCDHCGLLFRPQWGETKCCFACEYRAQGKTHRLQHTADCRRVLSHP